LGAFDQAGSQDGVGEVGGGFVEGLDGEALGNGAEAEALDLGEDEPDPVGGFALVAEFGEDFGVDGGLGVEEALQVVGVGHGVGSGMLGRYRCGGVRLWRLVRWGVVVGSKRAVSRFACGCAPAFGRAVGSSTRAVDGTAEAVPLRGLVRNGWGVRVGLRDSGSFGCAQDDR